MFELLSFCIFVFLNVCTFKDIERAALGSPLVVQGVMRGGSGDAGRRPAPNPASRHFRI